MPLSIAGVALLGWWGLGIALPRRCCSAPPRADRPGARLRRPVEGPSVEQDAEEIDEEDEVRFALTSEAGSTTASPSRSCMPPCSSRRWARSRSGVALDRLGAGRQDPPRCRRRRRGGLALGRIAFRSRAQSLRVAETGEPLLALAAVLLAYGASEVVGGYGFLAVFACAMTIRSAELHDYHALMHQVIERLERLLTLIVLLFVGIGLTHAACCPTWTGAAVIGVALVFVIRPLAGFVALSVGGQRLARGPGLSLDRHERLVTAFFGVRGIGSIYYLAYALGLASFPEERWLWSTVAFTIVLSVVVHGIAVTPVMRRLERQQRDAAGAA